MNWFNGIGGGNAAHWLFDWAGLTCLYSWLWAGGPSPAVTFHSNWLHQFPLQFPWATHSIVLSARASHISFIDLWEKREVEERVEMSLIGAAELCCAPNPLRRNTKLLVLMEAASKLINSTLIPLHSNKNLKFFFSWSGIQLSWMKLKWKDIITVNGDRT